MFGIQSITQRTHRPTRTNSQQKREITREREREMKTLSAFQKWSSLTPVSVYSRWLVGIDRRWNAPAAAPLLPETWNSSRTLSILFCLPKRHGDIEYSPIFSLFFSPPHPIFRAWLLAFQTSGVEREAFIFQSSDLTRVGEAEGRNDKEGETKGKQQLHPNVVVAAVRPSDRSK